MRTVAMCLAFMLGGVVMVAEAQDKKDDPVPKKAPPKNKDFDVWVVYVREMAGAKPGWSKEVPAKQYAVKDGVYYWDLGGYPTGGPQKGDKLTEEDGTVWVIDKKHGTGNNAVIASKVPPVKK